MRDLKKDQEYEDFKRELVRKITDYVGIDGLLGFALECWGDSPPKQLIPDILRYYDLHKAYFERE